MSPSSKDVFLAEPEAGYLLYYRLTGRLVQTALALYLVPLLLLIIMVGWIEWR